MFDILGQVESWENDLHDARFGDRGIPKRCDMCNGIFLPFWEEVETSKYDGDKMFCCINCRDKWEKENYDFLISVKELIK